MRAKIWSSLDELREAIAQNNINNSKAPHLEQGQGQGQRNGDPPPRRLVPHLSRTSLTFTAGNEKRDRRASSIPSSSSTGLRLLVTCNISLDIWTSEARLEPELSVFTVSPNTARIEAGARRMFSDLLRERTGEGSNRLEGGVGVSADAVCKAVEAVAKVLFAA